MKLLPQDPTLGIHEPHVIDGYVTCGEEAQRIPSPGRRNDIWCAPSKSCAARAGHGCHLFSRLKRIEGWDDAWEGWRHDWAPDEPKLQQDPRREYRCFCVTKVDVAAD